MEEPCAAKTIANPKKHSPKSTLSKNSPPPEMSHEVWGTRKQSRHRAPHVILGMPVNPTGAKFCHLGRNFFRFQGRKQQMYALAEFYFGAFDLFHAAKESANTWLRIASKRF